MPEPTLLAAAPAGIGMALAVLGATRPARDPAARWLGRRRAQPAPAGRPGTIRFRALPLGMFRPWLEAGLDQAGWRETPERFLAGVCLATIGASLTAAGLGALGGASGAGPAALAAVAVPTVAGLLLRRAQDRRREALVAELCPILELVSLELHAGGSSRSSLAAVLSQLRGDLAGELRRILISSQMTGSEPVESRLAVLAERLGP
ncbi:MAG: hypothetical protein ACREPA_03885, partial [Candidatus Dormibacteraceae bacterium]